MGGESYVDAQLREGTPRVQAIGEISQATLTRIQQGQIDDDTQAQVTQETGVRYWGEPGKPFTADLLLDQERWQTLQTWSNQYQRPLSLILKALLLHGRGYILYLGHLPPRNRDAISAIRQTRRGFHLLPTLIGYPHDI